MTETFTGDAAAELAVVERSGFIESRHLGSAVVISDSGEEIIRVGDPEAPIFPRSSLKPFQAIASMMAGADLTEEQVALAMASHTGTRRHVSVVRSTLASVGLSESALQCPPDWPIDRESRDELVRSGIEKAPVFMNCSGKHAAMLAACVASGWPIDSYLDEAHPLQVSIRDLVERFTREKPAATGVDGCGAPVHAVSLIGLASGIARIRQSNPDSPFPLFKHAARLVSCALRNPWAVEGPGRAATEIMERMGLFCKSGAEGVFVAAAPDGTTAAVKVLDGASRAAALSALALLARAGAVSAADVNAVLAHLDLTVLGRGEPVGQIRVGAGLREP